MKIILVAISTYILSRLPLKKVDKIRALVKYCHVMLACLDYITTIWGHCCVTIFVSAIFPHYRCLSFFFKLTNE